MRQFVKYKPKLYMQRLENNYKKYQKHSFRNPYNDSMISKTLFEYTIDKGKYQKHLFRNPYNDTMMPKTLFEYTTYKGYMRYDLHQYSLTINTIFYNRTKAQLIDISDHVSSMRSLNFSSYKPIN